MIASRILNHRPSTFEERTVFKARRLKNLLNDVRLIRNTAMCFVTICYKLKSDVKDRSRSVEQKLMLSSSFRRDQTRGIILLLCLSLT